jgi:hypothetical protein
VFSILLGWPKSLLGWMKRRGRHNHGRARCRVRDRVWKTFVALAGEVVSTTELVRRTWPRKQRFHPEEYRRARLAATQGAGQAVVYAPGSYIPIATCVVWVSAILTRPTAWQIASTAIRIVSDSLISGNPCFG